MNTVEMTTVLVQVICWLTLAYEKRLFVGVAIENDIQCSVYHHFINFLDITVKVVNGKISTNPDNNATLAPCWPKESAGIGPMLTNNISPILLGKDGHSQGHI